MLEILWKEIRWNPSKSFNYQLPFEKGNMNNIKDIHCESVIINSKLFQYYIRNISNKRTK